MSLRDTLIVPARQHLPCHTPAKRSWVQVVLCDSKLLVCKILSRSLRKFSANYQEYRIIWTDSNECGSNKIQYIRIIPIQVSNMKWRVGLKW